MSAFIVLVLANITCDSDTFLAREFRIPDIIHTVDQKPHLPLESKDASLPEHPRITSVRTSFRWNHASTSQGLADCTHSREATDNQFEYLSLSCNAVLNPIRKESLGDVGDEIRKSLLNTWTDEMYNHLNKIKALDLPHEGCLLCRASMKYPLFRMSEALLDYKILRCRNVTVHLEFHGI